MSVPFDKEAPAPRPDYNALTREQLIEILIAFEQTQCDAMVRQRNNLIREVHHRIKNTLQGVTGLLRLKANQHPELGSVIEQTIAQMRSVAVVHGLQGQAQDSEVVLCEMIPAIAKVVEALLAPLLMVEVCVQVPQRIRVSEQEAVPIALVLNELIMNAAKHTSVAQGNAATQIVISVSWHAVSKRAIIEITNPGMLPDEFDFNSANGLGIGLELVRSLLPPDGSTLRFRAATGQVSTRLDLFSPSIYNI